MSMASSPASPAAGTATETAPRSRLSLYLELAKARLSAMVVFSTAVGFVVAGAAAVDWARLLWTLVGTALAAGGASALNQVMEIGHDRRMHRTRTRPLPSGAITPAQATAAGLVMSGLGLLILGRLVSPVAAGLAGLSFAVYVLLYTPLKTRTSLNTLVGAVVGAIPPMIGWVAARGDLGPGAWVLAALLFVWQLPHFLSLAWLYREDYDRGGFAMLPCVDGTGELTCRVIVLTSIALLPIGACAMLAGIGGAAAATGTVVLGLGLTALAVRMERRRTEASARHVFLASIAYLPLVLCLLMVDRGPVGLVPPASAMVATAAVDDLMPE
jgi:protoheme IX farnesyltransferase